MYQEVKQNKYQQAFGLNAVNSGNLILKVFHGGN